MASPAECVPPPQAFGVTKPRAYARTRTVKQKGIPTLVESREVFVAFGDCDEFEVSATFQRRIGSQQCTHRIEEANGEVIVAARGVSNHKKFHDDWKRLWRPIVTTKSSSSAMSMLADALDKHCSKLAHAVLNETHELAVPQPSRHGRGTRKKEPQEEQSGSPILKDGVMTKKRRRRCRSSHRSGQEQF